MLYLFTQNILKLITHRRATSLQSTHLNRIVDWSTPFEGQELYDGIETHSSDAVELEILYLHNGVSVHLVS